MGQRSTLWQKFSTLKIIGKVAAGPRKIYTPLPVFGGRARGVTYYYSVIIQIKKTGRVIEKTWNSDAVAVLFLLTWRKIITGKFKDILQAE